MESSLVRHLIASVFTVVVAALAGATALVSQGQTAAPADLVLYNGRIATLETPADVQALAARGGRIVALGSDAEIKRYIGQGTEAIDLAGMFAMPGFIEGHGHFTGVGQAQLQLNLMKATSWDEIVAMVAAAVKQAKPGQWIYGRGWHQEKWKAVPSPNVEGFPTHDSLSRGVAGQSRLPDARQRPRQLRQRQGDAAVGRRRRHAESRRRRLPQGRHRASRPGCFARPPRG